MILSLLTAVLMSSTSPATAAAVDKPVTEKKICKTEQQIGSLLRAKKVCRTKAEWIEYEAEARDGSLKMQRPHAGG